MIEHEGKTFDDSILRPYLFSRRLAQNYYYDECEIFVVYGMPEGIGKSAYCNHVLADLKGYQNCSDEERLQWMWEKTRPQEAKIWDADWDANKPLVKYPPDDVVETCLHMLDNDLKDIAFHWDDSGTWLNAMDFHDPFVIAFMKYLSLARSNWGGIILSTPVEEWVLRKLRTARGIYHVEVKRMPGTDRRYVWRPRVGTCYKLQKYKGNPREYWPRQWQDKFMAIMPDHFFKWYEPQRKQYARIATQLMRNALANRKERGWTSQVAMDEEVLDSVEEHIWKANESASELEEAVLQKSPPAH